MPSRPPHRAPGTGPQRPGGSSARTGGRRGRQRAAQRRLALICIGVAVVLFVGLAVVLWQPWRSPEDASSAGLPASSEVSVPSVASSQPAASVSALPTQPDGPLFTFSDEDTARLNTLLDEWAAQTTYIRKTQDDDGNPLPTPQDVAAGGHRVAVWCLDLDSGAEYSYNAGEPFYYASMMKAPYAAYLYDLAGQGRCNLDEVVTVQPADVAGYEGNTGVLKQTPLPADYTVEQLLSVLIRDSDTVALRILLRMYEADGFVTWAEKRGVQDAAALHTVIYGHVNAADAGVLLRAVHDVMENTEYGGRLREHMENSRNKMITSSWPVARKYGWDTEAYHDMAVVYAPHPYLLVILTDKWGGSYAEQLAFGSIAATFEEILAGYWAAQE